MSKLGVPFDMTNFFVNRDKCMFFIHLKDVQNRKYKLYDLCKKTDISLKQSTFILKGLEYFGFIGVKYNSIFSSYIPVLTEKGNIVRNILIKLSKYMVDYDIWEDKNVKSLRKGKRVR
jgi:hypothetical protein